jgi:RNA polymerase sigma-70 factor (ECF subfamily)
MDKLSDAYYISQVVLFDSHKAFEKLVIKYQPELRRLLLRLTINNKPLSEDLAQETFIKAYRHINSYKASARFSTWLYRIAYNVFLDYQKQKKEQYLEPENENRFYSHNPTFVVEDKIDIEYLLKLLNDEERWAISLSYLDDMSHGKIAEIMNCPLGTVKSYILRGKEKLRKHITLIENGK